MGGVCPEEAEWAVKRLRSVNSLTSSEHSMPSSKSRNAVKCVPR